MIAGPALARLAPHERKALAAFVSRLRDRFAAEIAHLWFFGSKARGDDGGDSDLDVLVVVNRSVPGLWERIDALAVAVNLQFGVVISDHIVELARYEQMADWQEPILSDIRRDGVDLWALELSPVT